jgi:hypothetical protein
MKKHELLRSAPMAGCWLPIIILAAFGGCSKSNDTVTTTTDYNYSIDQEVFFTIQEGSTSYSSNGYYDPNHFQEFGGQSISFQKGLDSTGAPVVNIGISLTNVFTYGGGGLFGSTAPTTLILGNCQGVISMTKPGNELTGDYHILLGNVYDNQISGILSNQNQEKFGVDSLDLSLNITRQGQSSKGHDIVEGNFSFSLFPYTDWSKRIPATGTFRLLVIK